jgi:hypothetical protein
VLLLNRLENEQTAREGCQTRLVIITSRTTPPDRRIVRLLIISPPALWCVQMSTKISANMWYWQDTWHRRSVPRRHNYCADMPRSPRTQRAFIAASIFARCCSNHTPASHGSIAVAVRPSAATFPCTVKIGPSLVAVNPGRIFLTMAPTMRPKILCRFSGQDACVFSSASSCSRGVIKWHDSAVREFCKQRSVANDAVPHDICGQAHTAAGR